MDEQRYEYRTGSTQPQKGRRGLMALVLMAAIFLGGLFSALGLLHLLPEADRPDAPVSFSNDAGSRQDDLSPADEQTDALQICGMTVQTLSQVYRQMYNLPEGLFVSQVAEDSAAKMAGFVPGDVLLLAENTALTKADTLPSLLKDRLGEQVEILVYRNGLQYRLTLTVQ